ncbi:MAG: GNAT family N-acetyltransferase [Beijerinckiaceae bacterium]|jgi:CelD/BcsL family acetyltransferase involved in cellulose biosynthesis|nr:GNAT family N-acetyltransferase [Beijerinckiaceae bacterium]
METVSAVNMRSAAEPGEAMQSLAVRVHAGEAGLARLAASGTRPLTPFQRVEWLAAYLTATGETDAFRLVEIETPRGAVLLPLEISRFGPFRVADITGGKQASFHGVAIRGEPAFSAGQLKQALREAGRTLNLDALIITDAPQIWRSEDHPLAILPRQPSPSSGWAVTLESECETLFARLSNREDRKKQRYKANKLAQIGPVTAGWITEDAARRASIEQLFIWKAERFGNVGIDNPFAEPAMQEFLRNASGGPDAPIHIFGLWAGERLVAVMVCAREGWACSGMVNANDQDPDITKTSPGEQLLSHLLRTLCAEGAKQFDLGVGEARYKAHFCPEPVPLFDAGLAVNLRGQIATRLFFAMRGLKRGVKQNERLWSLVTRYRKWKAGQAASSARPG